MEAIVVDPRKTTPEEMERGMRDVKLVFGINHTMPYTEEYNKLVRPYGSESQVNPAGPELGTERVIRGGCRGALQPIYMRVSCRNSCDPDDETSGGIGLRLVLDEYAPRAN